MLAKIFVMTMAIDSAPSRRSSSVKEFSAWFWKFCQCGGLLADFIPEHLLGGDVEHLRDALFAGQVARVQDALEENVTLKFVPPQVPERISIHVGP
jgi:hypothetical protein